MKRKSSIILCVLLSTSMITACAKKNRINEETKPKAIVNAVTNARTSNANQTKASVANNTRTKVTNALVGQNNPPNYGGNNYTPPPEEPVTEEETTKEEVKETTKAQEQVTTKAQETVTTKAEPVVTTVGNNTSTENKTTTTEPTGTTAGGNTNTNTEPQVTTKAQAEQKYQDGEKVKLTEEVNVYETAEDARNKTNPVKTYKPGEFVIYKYDNGAVNISTADGQAGGWINSDQYLSESGGTSNGGNTNTGTEPVTTTVKVETTTKPQATDKFKAGDKVTLSEAIKVYETASDAVNGTNPLKTYDAGDYYIYKYSDGAVNIGVTKGGSGAWIPSDSSLKAAKTGGTTDTTKPTTKIVEVGDKTVTLNGKIDVYTSAEDAKNKVNSTKTYDTGKYFIYKEQDGMINITKNEGAPGAWINPNTSSTSTESGTGDSPRSDDNDTTKENNVTEEGGIVESQGDGYKLINGNPDQMPSELQGALSSLTNPIKLTYYGEGTIKSATIDKEYTLADVEASDEALGEKIVALLNNGTSFSDDKYDVGISKSGDKVASLSITAPLEGGSISSDMKKVINLAYSNLTYPKGSGNTYGAVLNEVNGLIAQSIANPDQICISANGQFIIRANVTNGKVIIRISDGNA